MSGVSNTLVSKGRRYTAFAKVLIVISIASISFSHEAASRSKGATAKEIVDNCRFYPGEHQRGAKVYSQREYARAYQRKLAQRRALNPQAPGHDEAVKKLSFEMTDLRNCDAYREFTKRTTKAKESCEELSKTMDYLGEQFLSQEQAGVFGSDSWAATFVDVNLKRLRPAMAKCLRELDEKCIDLRDPRQVRRAARILRIAGTLEQRTVPTAERNNKVLQRKMNICPDSTTRKCKTKADKGYTCQQYQDDADLILKNPINEKLWFKE